MVLERIKGVKAAPARPFLGPAPEYPKTSIGRELTACDGRVRHRRARSRGRPVGREREPAGIGESALAAIRLWRFVRE